MMVGVGGTGKSTVAKLAAYIQDCHFMKPHISRGYQNFEFREDLKKACMNAGIKGEKVVFFLTDNIVKVRIANSSEGDSKLKNKMYSIHVISCLVLNG